MQASLNEWREYLYRDCYEQHCIEFALYGDQREEDMRYEEMAQYDRWDGHRMEQDPYWYC